MKILDDYNYWMESKRDFLNQMKESESLIYDRLSPVILILEELSKKEDFDENEGYIFNVGFMYLYEQVNNIESYIASNFKTFEALDENSVAYNFLCELEDFKTDYTDLQQDEKDAVQDHIDHVESILLAKESISNLVYEEINSVLESYIEEYGEYLPVTEIFKQIAENYKLI